MNTHEMQPNEAHEATAVEAIGARNRDAHATAEMYRRIFACEHGRDRPGHRDTARLQTGEN